MRLGGIPCWTGGVCVGCAGGVGVVTVGRDGGVGVILVGRGCWLQCQVGIKKRGGWLLSEVDFVDSRPAEGTKASDAPAVGAEAVGSCDLLPLAFEAEEGRFTNAIAAPEGNAQVARLLEFVEELADLCGELFGAANVE